MSKTVWVRATSVSHYDDAMFKHHDVQVRLRFTESEWENAPLDLAKIAEAATVPLRDELERAFKAQGVDSVQYSDGIAPAGDFG